MGKQSKPRRSENIGTGKVTPMQIAFIVDRYLLDNHYTETRSTFRSEAAHLISKSPVREAPQSLLSLGAILDEYIKLKEQKVLMDQEQSRLEQEKSRVQNLLRGMQDVMNAYNASGNSVVAHPPPLPPPPVVSPAVSQANLAITSPAGYYPMYNSPVVMSSTKASSNQTNPSSFTTPITNQTSTKRNRSKAVSDGTVIAKKSRKCEVSKDSSMLPHPRNEKVTREENTMKESAVQSIAQDNAPNGSPAQGSNVVKCLFNQPNQSPLTNSSGPKTPPRASSPQTDKSTSPVDICSTATSTTVVTPQQVMSTNCTIISSETIRVSPSKQIAYYSIEKNHCISTSSPMKTNTITRPNKKDHVKGRLDFDADMPFCSGNPTSDGTSTSESDKEGNILDLDFCDMDALGFDFNLSELLVDFDIGGEGLGFSNQQAMESSPESQSGSPNESGALDMGASPITSHVSSTMTGILSEKDLNSFGPESVMMTSVTKCIKILSPVKTQRSSLDQENFTANAMH